MEKLSSGLSMFEPGWLERNEWQKQVVNHYLEKYVHAMRPHNEIYLNALIGSDTGHWGV